MFFQYALIWMMVKLLRFIRSVIMLELFLLRAWRDRAPKTTWISKLQLHSLVFVFFKHIKQKIQWCLKHSCVYTHTNAHARTHRMIFTHKKSLSPQALSCKTCLLEMDLDIGALSVRIFSPNTRQFLQRTKPHQCSHAHLSCTVSKALLCSYSLSLI